MTKTTTRRRGPKPTSTTKLARTMLDTVVQVREDGHEVTAGERIVGLLRAGMYLEAAAASAGINRHTVHGWLRTGARGAARLHALEAVARADGKPMPDVELSPFDFRCVEFTIAVAEAEAAWEAQEVNTLNQLARGGLVITKTTEKQAPNGDVTERTVVTEVLAPNPSVIMWRLARRFPDRYGNKVSVEDVTRRQRETDPSNEELGSDLADTIESWLGQL